MKSHRILASLCATALLLSACRKGYPSAVPPGDDNALRRQPIGATREQHPESGKSGRLYHRWEIETDRGLRSVTIEGQLSYAIPGSPKVSIWLSDGAGTTLDQWTFPTGWRHDLGSVALEMREEVAGPTITIATMQHTNSRDASTNVENRIYLGFSKDDLRLIRIENAAGQLARNNYASANHTIGPPTEILNDDQCIQLLGSPNYVDVLTVLAVLGGIIEDKSAAQQNAPRAAEFHRLRRNQQVVDMVMKYRESSNRWIREAAQMALSQDQ